MFLSLVPKHHQRDSWFLRRPITVFDDSEEESDEFLDELEAMFTTPVTFSVVNPLSHRRNRNRYPRRTLKRKHQDEIIPTETNLKFDLTPKVKKGRFEVTLDVDDFKLNELNVKLVDDCVVIEGKHQHKDENGIISRNFTRKFTIPEDVKIEELTCDLNAQGRMVISGPRKIEQQKNERIIPITVTSEGEKVGVETSGKSAQDGINHSETSGDKSEDNSYKKS